MLNSRIVIILIYLLSACFLGCLIAYPIYFVTELEFERVLSRSILVCVVLFFYPAAKYLHFNNPEDLGFVAANRTKTIYKAWLLGIAMLLPLSIFFISCGFRIWEPLAEQSFPSATTAIALAISSGLVIALVEETLFRGAIQTVLKAKFNSIIAIIIVSVIYSSVHFLQAPELSASNNIQWYSGFILFISAFKPLLSIHLDWDSWLALFMAGIFLSIVRLRTNNLFWCIGLHAGWVAHIKIVKTFTDRDASASCRQWAGDYDKYIGELSIIWIALILITWWVVSRNNAT